MQSAVRESAFASLLCSSAVMPTAVIDRSLRSNLAVYSKQAHRVEDIIKKPSCSEHRRLGRLLDAVSVDVHAVLSAIVAVRTSVWLRRSLASGQAVVAKH